MYERIDSSARFFVASPEETPDHPKSWKHGGVVQSSAYLPLAPAKFPTLSGSSDFAVSRVVHRITGSIRHFCHARPVWYGPHTPSYLCCLQDLLMYTTVTCLEFFQLSDGRIRCLTRFRKLWPLLIENTEFCQASVELQYSVYRKL